MQAILHIGDMKCGSKSIQGWLAANELRLRDLGFHRPRATCVEIYDSGPPSSKCRRPLAQS